MKAFSLLVLLLASTAASAVCGLRAPTVSLSAPVTALLEDLALLGHPQLKAISMFHAVQSPTSVPRLGGGLFLSQKTLAQFAGHTIFFDESGELQRRLGARPELSTISVRTRSLDPFEVTFQALEQLHAQLVGCEAEVAALREKYLAERTWLVAQKPFSRRMYFFLGEVTTSKWPELLMVADGPVLFWTRHGKLRTFASELAYVRWGEKWKKSLAPSDLLVGLAESKAPFAVEKTAHWNARGPGVLTPGPGQIRFMRQFVEAVAR